MNYNEQPQQMQNPFGMPMQIPNMPPVSELWKNEKEKYRPWLIIFGVGILVILALVIASSIYYMSHYEEIKEAAFIIYDKTFDTEVARAKALSYANNQVYTFPIIYIVILTIGAYLYASSLFVSYKKKSFARLSMFSNSILFFYALFEIFDLFFLMFSSEKQSIYTANAGEIIAYVNTVLVIALAFSAGRQVSNIRKQFFISERVEMIKKQANIMSTGQFQANAQPFINSPFGPIPQAQQPNQAPPVTPLPTELDASGQPQVQAIPKTPEQIRFEKLNALTTEQLQEIATKLSISGIDMMTRDELILDIMRITKDSTHFN